MHCFAAKRVLSRRLESKGSVVVELAFCLPLVVVLILGSVEACSMIFLKQSLTIASYEGGRKALEPGATTAEVESAINQILTDRRIVNSTIRITPSNLSAVLSGDPIEVEVTATAAGNGVVPLRFYSGRSLTGATTMLKEY